jgi:predicted SAM-dependent methyltransferase
MWFTWTRPGVSLFEDETFDYVMSEHMFEHIAYPAGQGMFPECFRILKPGGRVRFATPNLQVLLELLSTQKNAIQKEYCDWVIQRVMPEIQECKDVFAINIAFREWGISISLRPANTASRIGDTRVSQHRIL